jgi:hypothetical protein
VAATIATADAKVLIGSSFDFQPRNWMRADCGTLVSASPTASRFALDAMQAATGIDDAVQQAITKFSNVGWMAHTRRRRPR